METVEPHRRRLALRLKEEPDHPSAPDWARALEEWDRVTRLGRDVSRNRLPKMQH